MPLQVECREEGLGLARDHEGAGLEVEIGAALGEGTDHAHRKALRSGLGDRRELGLGGFALDPLYEEPGRADDPLLKFDNVILTPHTAAQPRFNALNDISDLIVGLSRALAA